MSALRKVLVVDDDPVVSHSFHRVLEHEGYVVVSAANAAEALSKLDEGQYDVVYSDIRMPGMSGLELAEKVKARRTWTPVVIITGYGNEASETRAKAAGVTAFLHKPLSPEMIESSAREALAATPPAPVSVEPAPVAAAEPPEVAAPPSGWKFGAMLVGAPLIGLAFVLLAPFVGLATLAVMAGKAFVQSGGLRRTAVFLKNVGLFVAAPLIGLVYVIAMPFVGIGALIWVAVRGSSTKEPTI
jgi:CheY-like chemotaxis protein